MSDTAYSDDAGPETAHEQTTTHTVNDTTDVVAEARGHIADAKRRSRLVFLAWWAGLSVLAVLGLGVANKWEFLSDDFQRDFLGAHWTVYREMLLAVGGSTALAQAIAQRLVIKADRQALQRVVEKTIERQSIRYEPNPRYVAALEIMSRQLTDLQSNFDPHGIDVVQKEQLADLIRTARDRTVEAQAKRIEVLEAQLQRDVQIFDGLRDAMGKAGAECEKGSRDADSARRA